MYLGCSKLFRIFYAFFGYVPGRFVKRLHRKDRKRVRHVWALVREPGRLKSAFVSDMVGIPRENPEKPGKTRMFGFLANFYQFFNNLWRICLEAPSYYSALICTYNFSIWSGCLSDFAISKTRLINGPDFSQKTS